MAAANPVAPNGGDSQTESRQQKITTRVLAASIRNPMHVTQAALAGADIATMPFTVLKQLFNHPLTDAGQKKFLEDYRKTQEAKPVATKR